MKKILFLLFSLFLTIPSYSQEYDELDLLGTWYPDNEDARNFPLRMKLVKYDDTKEGYQLWNSSLLMYNFSFRALSFSAFSDPKIDTVNFNAHFFWDKDQKKNQEVEGVGLGCFFISNSNKLHIIESTGLYTPCLGLIIKELTPTSLVLVTYDGTSEFAFKKQTTDISSTKTTAAKTNVWGVYNLNGNKINKLKPGINIIKQSDNKAKKVMVK